jgi:hypothetical protein
MRTTHLRAPVLAFAAVAVSVGTAFANPASDHLGGAAARIDAKLAAASADVSNADALAAIAAARQRVLDRLASPGGAGATATSATTAAPNAAADPLAKAEAGLTKAMDALSSNPTDADAGGLAGLTTAWNAVTTGLAHAQAGAANAGTHRP